MHIYVYHPAILSSYLSSCMLCFCHSVPYHYTIVSVRTVVDHEGEHVHPLLLAHVVEGGHILWCREAHADSPHVHAHLHDPSHLLWYVGMYGKYVYVDVADRRGISVRYNLVIQFMSNTTEYTAFNKPQLHDSAYCTFSG